MPGIFSQFFRDPQNAGMAGILNVAPAQGPTRAAMARAGKARFPEHDAEKREAAFGRRRALPERFSP